MKEEYWNNTKCSCINSMKVQTLIPGTCISVTVFHTGNDNLSFLKFGLCSESLCYKWTIQSPKWEKKRGSWKSRVHSTLLLLISTSWQHLMHDTFCVKLRSFSTFSHAVCSYIYILPEVYIILQIGGLIHSHATFFSCFLLLIKYSFTKETNTFFFDK